MRYKDVYCVDKERVIEVHMPNKVLVVSKESGRIFGIDSITLNGCAGPLLKALALVGKGCTQLFVLADAHEGKECPPEVLAHLIEVL